MTGLLRSVRRRIKETLAIRETPTGALGRTPTVEERLPMPWVLTA